MPVTSRLALLQAVNDWNRERIWPKVYVREEGQGLAMYAEVSVDLEQGATDDQLGQIVSCGLGTAVQALQHDRRAAAAGLRGSATRGRRAAPGPRRPPRRVPSSARRPASTPRQGRRRLGSPRLTGPPAAGAPCE